MHFPNLPRYIVDAVICPASLNLLEFGRLNEGHEAGVVLTEDLSEAVCRIVDKVADRACTVAVDLVIDCEENSDHCVWLRPRGARRSNGVSDVVFDSVQRALHIARECFVACPQGLPKHSQASGRVRRSLLNSLHP